MAGRTRGRRRSPHSATRDTVDEIERSAAELFELDSLVADSSSLILCDKAGFLPLLAHRVQLYLVPGVLAETGFEAQRLELLVTLSTYTEPETDSAVVRAAQETGLPLLSDDRTMLEQHGRAGGRFYNAVMVLTALFARGAVTVSEFERFRDELYRHCRYLPAVRAFAAGVYREVRKRRGE